MIMALVPPKWKTTIYQVNKSQMFYILSSRCYISTMASSEINTSWGKFELARCPSNLLDRATLLRELCPGHFQLHQDPLHHEMLRLTLKQAHIQQLRLLNSKAFLFASCYFDGFYWCFFLRMTLKIHLSLQDSCPKKLINLIRRSTGRNSSTSASWSRAHSSREGNQEHSMWRCHTVLVA